MLEQERQYTVWGFVWILHETEGRCKLYPSDRICLPVLRQGQTIRFKLFLNFIINQSIHSRLWKFPSFKMTRRAILRPLCDAILVWDTREKIGISKSFSKTSVFLYVLKYWNVKYIQAQVPEEHVWLLDSSSRLSSNPDQQKKENSRNI